MLGHVLKFLAMSLNFWPCPCIFGPVLLFLALSLYFGACPYILGQSGMLHSVFVLGNMCRERSYNFGATMRPPPSLNVILQYNRVSEKRNENKTKNAQGVLLMAGASRIWKFVKPNLLRVYDVDLLGLFLRFFTTSIDLRAVDRSVFCHLSARPATSALQSLSHTW